MADRFITRNGVRKAIDDSDPVLAEAARAKGWAFEDEADPAPVADTSEALGPETAPAFVRMRRGNEERDVSPDLLETARAKGWADVPTERVEYVQPGDRPATDADRAQATAQGFLKGASLGSALPQDYVGAAGDQIADWFDGNRSSSWDESLSMVRANREAVAAKAPLNALGGEIAGTVASALAPGGAANLAGRAGTAAAARVAPRLGAGMLGRALTAGTGLAAEGALYDAASTVAGGDDEFNRAVSAGDWMGAAQRLVSKPVEGALWNVAGGAVVSGVSKAAKFGLRSLRKGAQEAVEAADGELVQALDNEAIARAESVELRSLETKHFEETRAALNAAEDAVSLEAKAIGELEGSLARAAPKPPPEAPTEAVRMARAYDAAEGFEAHAREAVSPLKRALDVLAENAEYADVELGLAAKAKAIKAAENGYGQAISDPSVSTMLDGFAANLRREAESALDDATAKKLTGLAALAERANKYTGKKLLAGDVGDAYEVLDHFKREVGRMAAGGKRGPVRDTARGIYREIRPFLEREDLFGEAAKLQKPFNAVWAPEIGADSADAISGMMGRTGLPNTADEFAKAERVRAAWVESHLRNAGEGASDTDTALRRWVATKAASQSVRADLLASKEGLERAAKSREAMAEALRILDENAAKKAGAREWSDLERRLTRENLLGGGLKDQSAAAAVQFAADQTVGRVPVVGQVVSNALANRMTASELKQAMRAAGQQAEKNAAVRKAGVARAAAAVAAAKRVRDKAALKAAGREWTRKPERAVETLTPGMRQSVRELLLKLDEDRVQAETADPLSALTPALGPDLAAAYVEQRTAGQEFLRSKVPPPPEPTPFGTAPREFADEDLDRVARYASAMDDPSAAIDRMADGRATAEDLETLRELYPALLDEFRGKALAELTSRKRSLSYDEQLAMSDALGLASDPEATSFWSGVAAASIAAGQAKATPMGARADLPGMEGGSFGSRLG